MLLYNRTEHKDVWNYKYSRVNGSSKILHNIFKGLFLFSWRNFSLALLLFRSSKCFYRMILSYIVTSQSIAEEEDVTGMNGRIVIADDEPITRMDIRDILEEANYNVVGEATDGFEAIELCKSHQPDLVIMDIQMPLLDGLKAGNELFQKGLLAELSYLPHLVTPKTRRKQKDLEH